MAARLSSVRVLTCLCIVLLVLLLWRTLPDVWNWWKNLQKQIQIDECQRHALVFPQTPMPRVMALRTLVERDLQSAIRADFQHAKQMRRICRYSLEGGKLIRAVLTYSLAGAERIENPTLRKAISDAALSIEYIHSASLMLDDEMDGDQERRGKPSAYVKYGSTASQLAAMQLMTTAFVKTCQATDALKKVYGDVRGNELGMALFNTVSRNLQMLGMGQYLDLFPESGSWKLLGHKIGMQEVRGSQQVEEVIRKKTVTLFEVALVYGWLLRNGSLEALPRVCEMAYAMGMLFQIADDCQDYHMDKLRVGKNIAMNYVLLHGRKATLDKCHKLKASYDIACETLSLSTLEGDEILQNLIFQIEFFCKR